jgi:hypothetical protein
MLVGDFSSLAPELMVEDGSLKVLRILSHASAVIAEGEVDQLTAQRQVETSEEHYLHIINAGLRAVPPPPAASRPSAEAGEEAGAGSLKPPPIASSWSTTRSTIPRMSRQRARARVTTSAMARSPCR